jgi:hypothetical protein
MRCELTEICFKTEWFQSATVQSTQVMLIRSDLEPNTPRKVTENSEYVLKIHTHGNAKKQL